MPEFGRMQWEKAQPSIVLRRAEGTVKYREEEDLRLWQEAKYERDQKGREE